MLKRLIIEIKGHMYQISVVKTNIISVIQSNDKVLFYVLFVPILPSDSL